MTSWKGEGGGGVTKHCHFQMESPVTNDNVVIMVLSLQLACDSINEDNSHAGGERNQSSLKWL